MLYLLINSCSFNWLESKLLVSNQNRWHSFPVILTNETPVFYLMWKWLTHKASSMACAVIAGGCREVMLWLRCTVCLICFFKAIWRDWSLPDRRRQPVRRHHVQVEGGGGAGERPVHGLFSQYSSIVSHLWSVGSFSSSTRQAALHGAKFKTQTLRLAWHKAVTAVSSEDPDEAEPEDDEVRGRLWTSVYLSWWTLEGAIAF